MGLSKEGIGKARAGAAQLRNLARNLKASGSDLKNVLRNNGNYQLFKAGTDKGTAVDANLNETVDTVVDELAPKVDEVSSVIEAFCARQEELNREELENAAENGTVDLDSMFG